MISFNDSLHALMGPQSWKGSLRGVQEDVYNAKVHMHICAMCQVNDGGRAVNRVVTLVTDKLRRQWL